MKNVRCFFLLVFALWGQMVVQAQGPCVLLPSSGSHGFNSVIHNNQTVTFNQNLIFSPGTPQDFEIEWFNFTGGIAYIRVAADFNGNGIPDFATETIHFSSSIGIVNTEIFAFIAPPSGSGYPMKWWAIIDDGPILSNYCSNPNGGLFPVGIEKLIQELPTSDPRLVVGTSSNPGDPVIIPPQISWCFLEDLGYGILGGLDIPFEVVAWPNSLSDVVVKVEIKEVLLLPNGAIDLVGVKIDNPQTSNSSLIQYSTIFQQGNTYTVPINFSIPWDGLPSHPSSFYNGQGVPLSPDKPILVATWWLEDAFSSTQLPLMDVNNLSLQLPYSLGEAHLYFCGSVNARRNSENVPNESIKVELHSSRLEISLIPSSAEFIKLNMFDIHGREIIRYEDFHIEGDRLKLKLDFPEIPVGLYTLLIETRQGMKIQKIILK